jgi:hypothetical protein
VVDRITEQILEKLLQSASIGLDSAINVVSQHCLTGFDGRPTPVEYVREVRADGPNAAATAGDD